MEGRGLPGAAADDQTAGRVDEKLRWLLSCFLKSNKIGPRSLLSERLWDEGRWSHAISMLMTTHIKRINVAGMWPRNLTPAWFVCARVSACVTETQDCNRNGLANESSETQHRTAGIMSAFREM